ncbi:MAG TPA: nickel-responsive transcriptional regulator NikR [Kiritimatiellia bacterium]|nr:nickel-responsive transcriptional regulator NikR [Kiritimatiellia bacterium]
MLERFSISMDAALLKAFDRYLTARSYPTRSEGVRDLVRSALVNEAWESNQEVVGVITLVFDHHQRHLLDRMTEIQHRAHHAIVSTTHIHLNHHDCLEVIIVREKAGAVRKLAGQLIALKGVKNGNLSLSSTGDHLP